MRFTAMKKYNILSVFALAGLMGCSDYLDVNKNPSTPQLAASQTILPPMFAQMARGEQFDSRFAGSYTQNWASTASANVWDRHGYATSSDAGAEKWRSHYFSNGKNLFTIMDDATASNRPSYGGIAKAIWAWSLQSTTDWHGDMIIKQVFEFGRYAFDFDPQELAYAEAVKWANEAITDLAKDDPAAAGTIVRADLVYGGDRAKWTRFANGVLARNANHLSNKATYSPDKVIEFVDKALSSNADNFLVPHAGTTTDDGNFFGPLRNNIGGFRPTVFSMSLVSGGTLGAPDPRQSLLFNASVDGQFRGIVSSSGDPNTTAATIIPTFWGGNTVALSGTGRGMFRDNAPYPIMTYGEMQFIKAEAAFRKGDRATSFTAYRNGINASFDLLNSLELDATRRVTMALRTGYLASRAVAQTAADLTLSNIMLQKYIAMYGHGMLETWVDMRRFQYNPDIYTGFTLPASLFPDNSNKPVQRVRPRFNSEYMWNAASLARIGADKPDYHTVEMWFSQK